MYQNQNIHKTVKQFFSLIFLVILFSLFRTDEVSGANRFSVASGNWSSTSTWAATSGGTSGVSAPVAGDVVTIEGGFNVTLTANAACGSITFTTVTATSLTLGTYQLDVSTASGGTGVITIPTFLFLYPLYQ